MYLFLVYDLVHGKFITNNNYRFYLVSATFLFVNKETRFSNIYTYSYPCSCISVSTCPFLFFFLFIVYFVFDTFLVQLICVATVVTSSIVLATYFTWTSKITLKFALGKTRVFKTITQIFCRESIQRKRGRSMSVSLTLILLTWWIWWAPNNARKWQMGFNSAFKGLNN